MAESAYHNEALRRTRVIQRKNEAVQRKMNDCKGISQTPVDVKRNTNILFSGQLDFDTNRNILNWTGTERCRRQYDHSRNGPLLDSSWLNLRRELSNIGRGTPLNPGEGHSLTFKDLVKVRVVSPKK